MDSWQRPLADFSHNSCVLQELYYMLSLAAICNYNELLLRHMIFHRQAGDVSKSWLLSEGKQDYF
jgi:hypothetical protein